MLGVATQLHTHCVSAAAVCGAAARLANGMSSALMARTERLCRIHFIMLRYGNGL